MIGRFAERFALATGTFNGGTSTLGKGVRLDRQIGRQRRRIVLAAARHNLVNFEFGLCDTATVQQRFKIDGTAGCGVAQGIGFDDIVNRLGVTGSRGLTDKLGQATVQWDLSTFKTRPRRFTGTTLLSAHTKTARGALSSRNAPALALSGLARTGRWFQIVEREFIIFHIVNGAFVRLAAFPVKQFHGKCCGTAAAAPRDSSKSTAFRNKGVRICSRDEWIDR